MKALYFDSFGTSDVLRYGDVSTLVPTPGHVLVRTGYIGLNFADIYRRRGTYHIQPNNPYINGYEASGVVVEGDEQFLGRNVLFVDVPLANAEIVAVPVEKLILLPDGMDLKLAATVGLQGLTADFLVHDLGRNKPGNKVFITGVSGGVGQLLAQMLIADGMEVSGSASSPEKRQTAIDLGVREVLPSREDGWVAGYASRFDTVYDGFGATLNNSVAMVKDRGSVVLFGFAAGDPPCLDMVDLVGHSKNILTGDLWDFLTSAEERQRRADRLFGYLFGGKIRVADPVIFPLNEGKAAHDLLESGTSTGKILLTSIGMPGTAVLPTPASSFGSLSPVGAI